MLTEELAEVKRKNEATKEEEDIHLVFELNFLSDTCLSEVELREYRWEDFMLVWSVNFHM